MELERSRLTKDGSIFPVQISLNYVNFNGKEFCLEFARDLTTKRERDEAIQLSYHTMNSFDEIVYWLRTDGSFRYFNDAFCKKTGYSRQAIETMHVLDFYPGVTFETYQTNWEQIRKEGRMDGVYEVLKKDGTTFPVEGSYSMIEFAGEELILGLARDITNRKNKEKELQDQLAENEILRRQLEKENIILKEEIKLDHNFANIISISSNYKKVLLL
ncbi:MAG: PAS domain S-box protein [Richelia sp. SM2_1_7]|nr:PAS domain S-box protein [Richelia sp. SM2_1_7]